MKHKTFFNEDMDQIDQLLNAFGEEQNVHFTQTQHSSICNSDGLEVKHFFRATVFFTPKKKDGDLLG